MTWHSKQLLKSLAVHDTKKLLSKRPKNTTDEEWIALCAEYKLNKLIVLDEVPKEKKDSKRTQRK